MGDWIGFFALLFAGVLNPLGLRGAVIDALRSFAAATERQYLELDERIGKLIGKPISTALSVNAVILIGMYVAALRIVHGMPHEGFLWVKVVMLTSVSSLFAMAVLQRHFSAHRPRSVSFFASGLVLIASVLVSFIALYSYAVAVRSGWLFALSIAAYLQFIFCMKLVTLPIAWAIDKGGEAVEIGAAAVGEPILAIPPGIELKNLPPKIKRFFDLFRNEKWAAFVNKLPALSLVVAIPQFIVVSLCLTQKTAVVMAAVTAVGAASAFYAVQAGLSEAVSAQRKRVAQLFLYAAVPATIFIHAFGGGRWIERLVNGEIYVVEAHRWWILLLVFLFSFVVFHAAKAAVKEVKSVPFKVVAIGIPCLAMTWVFISFIVTASGLPGWSPWATEATMVSSAPSSGSSPLVDIKINATANVTGTAHIVATAVPPAATAPKTAAAVPPKRQPTVAQRRAAPKTDAEAEQDFDALAARLGVKSE